MLSPAKTPAGIRAEPLVSLENVGILRNGRWLVRGVDFSVSRGEIVTLIGPNGSGKSTSAKAAIGVLKPDEGRVERNAGLKVGYVPQKLSIDWTLPLSVRRLMTLTGPLPERDILSALESAGIAHMLEAEVQHLSGGEFQRALMARAIARKPDLLVLDEPVQGVDFSGEIALYDLIKSIRTATGCGILLISHDLHVVMVCIVPPDAIDAAHRKTLGAALDRQQHRLRKRDDGDGIGHWRALPVYESLRHLRRKTSRRGSVLGVRIRCIDPVTVAG